MFDRANAGAAGGAKITYGGKTFFTRNEVVANLAHRLSELRTSMHGRIGSTRGPRMVTLQVPLLSVWDSLDLLFPSEIMTGFAGARIFTGADKALILHARNGDRLTLHNARITGLSNLKLAHNQDLFGGNVTFTCLVKAATEPSAANSLYAFDNAAYVEDAAFPSAKLFRGAWLAAWGAAAPWNSFRTRDGWEIDWDVKLEEDPVDGVGVVDFLLQDAWVRAKSIPVGVTPAQVQAAFDPDGDVGEVHAGDTDLVLTAPVGELTLAKMAIVETGIAFSPTRQRVGPTVWETAKRSAGDAALALAEFAVSE